MLQSNWGQIHFTMKQVLQLLFSAVLLLSIQKLTAQAGCTDPGAHNYDSNATMSDGSCETCFDGIKNGDEFDVDCGGGNPNCQPCVLARRLDVEGNAKVRGYIEMGGNAPVETLLRFPNNEGFNLIKDENFLGTSKDCYYFEKTDANSADPDGCISFVNTGNDGIKEPLLTLRGYGAVGVGTTEPATKLHVNGITTTGIPGTNNTLLTLNAERSWSFKQFGTGSNTGIQFTPSSSTNQNKVFIINSTANVGIGGDFSPDYKLEVNGTAGKPGGGSWSNSSDKRLKKDIKEFNIGLETIEKIDPIFFHYNGKDNLPTNEEYVGVIAQELQKIAPFMVSEYAGDDGELYLAVDPSAFDFILINAVKELKVELAQRDIQVNNLSLQLKRIEARLNKDKVNIMKN